MRIGFVTDDAYPGFGGQAAATEAHVRALRDRSHEVRVLVGRQRGATTPPPGVEVERLPVIPLGSLAHIALPVPSRVRELVLWADVVQVNLPGPLAWWTQREARLSSLPLAMGLHIQEENTSAFLPGVLRPPLEAALRATYRWLFGRADLVIAPTPFAARLAERYGPPKVEVVSNGIEAPPLDAEGLQRATQFREEFLGGGGGHLLCYVGRLYPEKRPEQLLEILHELIRRGSRATLAIAGRGPLADRLEARASELGITDHVHFLGFLPEVDKAPLLAASDVFLMPSEVELQSIATLEAMAYGCAIFAAGYPTSAVPELVRGHGVGDVYPPDDAVESAAMLDRLLADPQRLAELQSRAVDEAERYRLPSVALRLEQVYEELIATYAT